MWCGKQREASAPIESLVKLQPWFLSLLQNCTLGSCDCSDEPALRQNTLMMIILTVSDTNLKQIYSSNIKKHTFVTPNSNIVVHEKQTKINLENK